MKMKFDITYNNDDNNTSVESVNDCNDDKNIDSIYDNDSDNGDTDGNTNNIIAYQYTINVISTKY